jgi:hypothetical protein
MVKYQGEDVLRRRLQLEYYLYVSGDAEKLARINHPNAINYSDLPNYITKRGKFR